MTVHNTNSNSPTGADLQKEGCKTVAKVSLWESQKNLIDKVFDWSEQCHYLWQWFETVYRGGQEDHSTREISFVYFLAETEVFDFRKDFPVEMEHLLRYEPFNPDAYDYYRNCNVVLKHPDIS